MNRDPVPPMSATLRADPPADEALARMLADAVGPHEIADRVAAVNREIARWSGNADLAAWEPGPDTDPRIGAALRDYLAACRMLPDWADPHKIALAEEQFMDMSMLSCTLLFCASLPECYVLPDLSSVLHAAGQLEHHTDYRIRSTAAMIFPVMMRGGLATPAGGGVAQALKVRLIHATVRHLILRGAPGSTADAAPVLASMAPAGGGMYHILYAHGWDGERDGLPCNQEELAYTLLTFHYVFLRGLRRLGLGLARADEEAYLHAWNVLGHMLGIERGLMAWTMKEAEALFHEIQARGRAKRREPDPRPALAAALMAEMAGEMPLRLLKPFPILLTRLLCGKTVSKDLGLGKLGPVPLLSRLLFAVGYAAVRVFDAAVRLFVPDFSISRMLTRVAGYRLVTRFLMDQTRPLRLPEALLGQVNDTLHAWDKDPRAPRWLGRLEARLAGRPPAAGDGKTASGHP